MRIFRIGMASWIVVALMVAAVGCQTSKVGAKNIAGKVVIRVDATPEQVITAAEKVVDQMKLNLVSSASTSLDGQVIARTAQDKRVTIKAYSEGKSISKVTVRVGAVGDEAVSLRILDGIETHLAGGTD